MNAPGMDEAQRKADAQTWSSTPDMITGGKSVDVDPMAGVEVTAPFGLDPLGKTKSK